MWPHPGLGLKSDAERNSVSVSPLVFTELQPGNNQALDIVLWHCLGKAILHSMLGVISLSILGQILIPIPVSNSPFNFAFKTAPGS